MPDSRSGWCTSSAAQGRLGDAAVARVAEALRAFLAIARSAGAQSVVAVATAAVRESTNRREFVGRVAAETGVRLEILDGDAEARYMFAGAVHGLPVDSGLVIDIGGGSVEICHFRDRRPLRQWTLPLGALRLSDRFLVTDPPRPSEQGRLRQHALATIVGAGVPPLRPGEQLVGTGGTLRNLAKIDRARRTYPITRLHGYQLNRADLDVAVNTLATRPMTRRRRVTGLSDERADSIVGGALCAQVLLDTLSADHLVLSGRGLREGVALERLGLQVRSAPEVRRSSVEALARRFATWDSAAAQLRVLAGDVTDRQAGPRRQPSHAGDPGARRAARRHRPQHRLLLAMGARRPDRGEQRHLRLQPSRHRSDQRGPGEGGQRPGQAARVPLGAERARTTPRWTGWR